MVLLLRWPNGEATLLLLSHHFSWRDVFIPIKNTMGLLHFKGWHGHTFNSSQPFFVLYSYYSQISYATGLPFEVLQWKCCIKWSRTLAPAEAHLQMPFLFKTLLPSIALSLWFPVNLQTIWQCFCPKQFDSNSLVIFVKHCSGRLTKAGILHLLCSLQLLLFVIWSNETIHLPWPNWFYWL